jgi:hypothetical protein
MVGRQKVILLEREFLDFFLIVYVTALLVRLYHCVWPIWDFLLCLFQLRDVSAVHCRLQSQRPKLSAKCATLIALCHYVPGKRLTDLFLLCLLQLRDVSEGDSSSLPETDPSVHHHTALWRHCQQLKLFSWRLLRDLDVSDGNRWVGDCRVDVTF